MIFAILLLVMIIALIAAIVTSVIFAIDILKEWRCKHRKRKNIRKQN